MGAEQPNWVPPYNLTPVFDQNSLPQRLRHEHRTKPGVWAVIRVLEGQLRYRIIEPRNEQILSPDAPGLIRPEQRHEVEPIGDVRFFVEFYASEPPLRGPSTDKNTASLNH